VRVNPPEQCGVPDGYIATIVDPPVARKILLHLGRSVDPLPRARARDPTAQTSLDFGDAA